MMVINTRLCPVRFFCVAYLIKISINCIQIISSQYDAHRRCG